MNKNSGYAFVIVMYTRADYVTAGGGSELDFAFLCLCTCDNKAISFRQ